MINVTARRTLGALGVLVLASCFDSTGPDELRPGRISVTPDFSAAFSSGVAFDEVRIRLTRPGSSTEVLDSTFVFPPGSDSLIFAFEVDLTAATEQFTLLMELIDQPGGSVVFTVGPVDVTARATGGEATQLPPAIYVGPGANAAGVRFISTPSEVTFNDSVLLTAEAFAAGGAAMAGVPIRWSSSDTSRAFLRTDSTGRLVARAQRGTVAVQASLLRTSAAAPPSVSHNVTVQPTPNSLVIQSGNNQNGAAGTALGQPVTVRVNAADGIGVRGVSVSFAVTSGGGSLSSPTAVTNANGDAAVNWTLGPGIGPQSVTASVGSIGASQIVNANAVVGPPAVLLFVQQPTDVNSGQPITPAVTVRARDAFGNNVTTYTGAVTIGIAANPGGATLGGTTTVNAVAGVATFANLTLSAPGAGYTLSAAATGLTGATSASFTVGSAAPVAIAFQVQPSTSAAGAIITPAVQVRAVDGGGNTATSFTGTVALTFEDNPGGAVLNGTTSVAAVNGVATFSDLSITAQGADYTLRATTSGLPFVVSSAFNITATTLAWTNPAGGSWSNPANWSLGRVPSTTDSVLINLPGSYTVTLDTTFDASFIVLGDGTGGQTLSILNRTLTVDGGMLILPGAIFRVHSSTVDGVGSVVNTGVIQVNAVGTFSLPLSTAAGSTISLVPDGSTGFATLSVPGPLVNGGLIEMTSIGSAYSATVSAALLVNGPTGTIATLAGAGGSRTITAELLNQGAISVGQPLTLNGNSADHSNAGTITLAGGGLTLNQTGATPSFTNTGTVAIGAGQTFLVSGGLLVQSAGAISGPGTLSFSGATGDFTTDLDNSAMGLTLFNSALNGPGTLINGAGRTLPMHNSSVGALMPFTNNGTLVLNATVNINGPLTTGAGSLIRLLPDGSTGFTTLNVAGTFANSATLELTSTGSAYSSTVVTGTLINTGTIAVLPGAGGPRTITAAIDNQALLQVDQPLTVNGTSSDHLNSGTINLAGGGLALSQGGTSPSFTNSGAITIGAGFTLGIAGGTLNQNGGSIGGPGTLSLNGVTANFATNVDNATTSVTVFNSTLNGPGTLTNATGQTLTLHNSTLGASMPFINNGTLITNATVTVNGGLATGAGSLIRLQPDGSTGFTSLNVAGTFTNSATIEMTSIGAAYTSAIGAGTLVNTGTIAVLPGAGGARTITAALDNQSLLQLDQPLTMNGTSAAHSNSGTINLAGGGLVLNQGGTSPSFTNSGTVTIGAGLVFAISNGTLNQNSGAIGGPGTLSLSSVTANFVTNLSNATTALSVINSTLNGPGSLTNAAGRTLAMHNSTIGATMPFTNDGTLITNATVTVNSALTTGAGSLIRLQPDGSTGFSTFAVAGTFTNSATVEMTSVGSGYSSTITTGTIVNTGTIAVLPGAGGPRTITAALDNQSVLQVDQPLTMNGTSAAHTNTGTINLAGGGLTLTQGGTAPSFTNSGAFTIGAGLTFAINNGTLNQNGGTLGGAGTLALNSVTANFVTNLTNATTALVIANSTLNGPGTLTNAAGQSLTLHNSTLGATMPLVNDGTLILNATVNVTGGLTTGAGSTIRLQPDGSTGFVNLAVPGTLTNGATIEMTSVGSGYTSTITTGTLLNTGTLDVLVGAGGPRTLAAALDNQGVVNLLQPLTITGANAAHANSGTIDATAANLTINQTGPGTFSNAGTLTIGAGRSVQVNSGGFTQQSGGTLAGGGTLGLGTVSSNFQSAFTLGAMVITGGTASFATPLSTAGMAWTLAGGTLNAPAGFTNAPAATLAATSFTFGATTPFDNQGTLVINGTVNMNGPLTTAGSSVIRMLPDGSTGNATLSSAGGFTNLGAIELTSSVSGYSSALNAGGPVINNGSISVLPGTGGPRSITAEIQNAGTITIAQPLTLGATGVDYLNTGTIQITGGGLTVNQGGATPSFTNAGTVDIGAGLSLAVNGGAFTHQSGGTLGGGGALSLSAVAADFQAGFALGALSLVGGTVANFATAQSTAGMAWTLSNTTINAPAGFTNAAGQTLAAHATTFGATTPLDNQGTLVVNATVAVNDTLVTGPGSLIRMQPDGGTGFAGLNTAAGFINAGSIELTSTVSAYSSSLTSAGPLINNGTLSVLPGTGGNRTIAAELHNGGTMTVAQGLVLSAGSADHVNTGTLQITAGGMSVNQSGTTPSFTNAATLTVNPGFTLAFNGGAFTHQAGATLNGGGALDLNGVTADLQAGHALASIAAVGGTVASFATAQTTAGMTWFLNNATINAPAGFTNAAGQTLAAHATTFGATTAFTNQGTLVANATVNISGPLGTAAGSVLRVQPDGSTGFANIVVANGFNNLGTIELTSTVSTYSSQFTVTSGELLNSGTVNILAGTGGSRTISGLFGNQGVLNVLTGSAGQLNVNGSFNNGGTINLELGGLTPVSQYDRIAISGSASLSGTLNVSLINAFTPATGNQFDLLTFASGGGTFTTVNAPSAGWGVVNTGLALRLTSP